MRQRNQSLLPVIVRIEKLGQLGFVLYFNFGWQLAVSSENIADSIHYQLKFEIVLIFCCLHMNFLLLSNAILIFKNFVIQQ